MNKKKLLGEIKKRLVKTYHPLEIYLFGSYAWGTPTRDSDVDLLIVVEHSKEKSFRRPLIGYDALDGLEIPNDLIVYTREEFDRSSNDLTTLEHKIKEEGELIYARS